MSKTLTNILIGLFAVLIVLLVIAAVFIAQDTFGDDAAETVADEVAVVEAAATSEPAAPAATDGPPATATDLPVPEVVEFSTNTPAPTPIPTDTPVPTDTPEPTATATNPPPTNPPPPPPPPATNTPIPPTAPPPPPPGPTSVNGIIGTHFALQPRSTFAVGQQIWFEFAVANQSGGDVPYGALGAMVRRDGADVQYKNSWGGNMDVISPNGLSADDNLVINSSGNYTIRLVICFDAHNTCINGGGTFHTLSQEISFTIP